MKPEPDSLARQKEHLFRSRVRRYYRLHRRSMPWRETRDPYRIFVSEIMLQQTQVARVLEKYPSFVRALTSFRALAAASAREVLFLWQGLGYNRRALFLHRAAQVITRDHRGLLPCDHATLRTLPGIGEATAGSLLAFAYNAPAPFIETNIRRVYLHHFFPGRSGVSDKEILPFVERTLDSKNPREWYYALMDYGAMLAKTVPNPNVRSASYSRQKGFKGSVREARGAILKILLREKGAVKPDAFLRRLPRIGSNRIREAISSLLKDGMARMARRGDALVLRD